MHRRCYMPSQLGWKDYGARGITVCHRWHKFDAFLADMGEQPEGMTIERKDPDGHYAPDNCVWVPRIAQARNKRNTHWLTHGGETLCLSEWAERLGIKPKTLRARIDDRGWSVEKALTTPVMTVAESTRHAQRIRWDKEKKK